MTPANAIAAHLARLPADPEGLRVDTLERLAIRDPPGEWSVQLHDVEVRIFLKGADRYASRRVFALREVDRVVDRLLAVAGGSS